MAEKSTIARPYAQAAFALAKESDALATWSETLALMAAVVVDADIRGLLANPRVATTQLADLLIGIAGDQIDDARGNLLRLLAENRRLSVLPEIAAQFEALKSDEERSVRAHVASAYALTADQQAKLAAALTKFLGRDVQLDCEVDKSLLGGAVIHAGDQVIDGSALGKLGRLAAQMEG